MPQISHRPLGRIRWPHTRAPLVAGLLVLLGVVPLNAKPPRAQLATATTTAAAPPASAPKTVTRAEVITTAEAYLLHAWTPSARNVFHGKDTAGIPLDTPDIGFQPTNGTRPGWWRPGESNIGVPYMWGGFCSLAEFDAGVRAGKAAGDVYSAYKREKLEAAVSGQAVGIDCSGLISRCWKLLHAHSTRRLAMLCDELPDPRELKAGDIMNLHNAHVLLFKEWTNPERTRLCAYEAGSPPTWKVLLNDMPLKFLTDQGYKPYRYRGIRD